MKHNDFVYLYMAAYSLSTLKQYFKLLERWVDNTDEVIIFLNKYFIQDDK